MASSRAVCNPDMVIEHSKQLQSLEDGHEVLKGRAEKLETAQSKATTSRSNLHTKIETVESTLDGKIDKNTARMDKWVWIGTGAGAVLSIAVTTIGFLLTVFWWAINNQFIVKTAAAVNGAS